MERIQSGMLRRSQLKNPPSNLQTKSKTALLHAPPDKSTVTQMRMRKRESKTALLHAPPGKSTVTQMRMRKRKHSSVAIGAAKKTKKEETLPPSVTLPSSEQRCLGPPDILPPKLISSFNCGPEPVYAITPTADDCAWVLLNGAKFELHDKFKGKVIKRVNLHPEVEKVTDLTLDRDGNLLLSCHSDRSCIKKMTTTGFTDFYTLERDYVPYGIAWHSTGNTEELLVCLDPYGYMAVVSPDGKLLRKDYLKSLWEVAVNGNNNDVCIITEKSRKVLILDSSLQFRVEYRASRPRGKRGCNFRGLCCDKYNRILVLDKVGKCVHLLDGDGQFLQLLLTEADGLVNHSSIAVDETGHVWIGECNGDVKVYSYM